jgi:GT2 family glycosyltransferase/glycosyltransferase involved in cell wall biosynthesis
MVVSWQTGELTRQCLDSLPGSVAGPTTYEVIVVDNGSTDGSVAMLQGTPGINLITNQENVGYAAAVNQAYRQARGEYILLLNSDARMSPASLSRLVRFLQQRPDAAGVAPTHLYPDGTTQVHCREFPTVASTIALSTGLQRLAWFRARSDRYNMAGADFSSPRPVAQPAASCLLLRRVGLDQKKLLDERYPLYYNDVDLARRIHNAGKQLWLDPSTAIVHELGASCRLLPDRMRNRHYLSSVLLYTADNLQAPLRWAFPPLFLLYQLLRLAVRRPDAIPLVDLWGALRRRPGPLPQPASAPWVIYCSATRWDVVRHRQHALTREIARNRPVLFVEPPSQRFRWKFACSREAPNVWVATVPSVLPGYRYLPLANRLNRAVAGWYVRRWLDVHPGPRLLWLDEDLAVDMAGHLGEQSLVYDVTDLDWTFTRPWNRWHLRRAARRCVLRADVVFTSSTALDDNLPARPRRLIELVNGCDPHHFSPTGPIDPSVLSLPAPRIGYLGSVDTRCFDTDLMLAVARVCPEWTFVLAGPAQRTVGNRFQSLPNVHLLGDIAYEHAPEVIRSFDVCLIPYRITDRTRYVHPKKLYEYLATGRPVVSTPLPAVVDSGAPVLTATTAAEFVAAIEACLGATGDAATAADRRRVSEVNSWRRRGRVVDEVLGSLDGYAPELLRR